MIVFGVEESRKETEREKSQNDIIDIHKSFGIFKPTNIRSISYSTTEINQQPEINPISVIRLISKSTKAKLQRPIIIELDYVFQAQEMFKTSF